MARSQIFHVSLVVAAMMLSYEARYLLVNLDDGAIVESITGAKIVSENIKDASIKSRRGECRWCGVEVGGTLLKCTINILIDPIGAIRCIRDLARDFPKCKPCICKMLKKMGINMDEHPHLKAFCEKNMVGYRSGKNSGEQSGGIGNSEETGGVSSSEENGGSSSSSEEIAGINNRTNSAKQGNCDRIDDDDIKNKVDQCGKKGACTLKAFELKLKDNKGHEKIEKYFGTYKCLGFAKIQKATYEIYMKHAPGEGKVILYHNGFNFIGTPDTETRQLVLTSNLCKDVRNCSGDWRAAYEDNGGNGPNKMINVDAALNYAAYNVEAEQKAKLGEYCQFCPTCPEQSHLKDCGEGLNCIGLPQVLLPDLPPPFGKCTSKDKEENPSGKNSSSEETIGITNKKNSAKQASCDRMDDDDIEDKIDQCGQKGVCTFKAFELKLKDNKGNERIEKYFGTYKCLGTAKIASVTFEIYRMYLSATMEGKVILYHDSISFHGSPDTTTDHNVLNSDRCENIRECSGKWEALDTNHSNGPFKWINVDVTVEGETITGKTGRTINIHKDKELPHRVQRVTE